MGAVIYLGIANRKPPSQSDGQATAPLRLSWHTLNPKQKQHYIHSIRCLLDHPTTLPPNIQPKNHTSLYSDFPYIHSHLGYATHHNAPFLPWHRYLLHVYETALRDKCGYSLSGLVYWDWTLEWSDLAHSSVFDPETGFGGDGDRSPNANISIGTNGRCVKDGPFNDIVVNFYDIEYKPHCLSRGFRNDKGEQSVIDGSLLSPESVEEVLQKETYADFVVGMEEKLHDVIPFGIGGDFETFTAPYDPLFFLHHTQLDRLWGLWQQRQSPERLNDYRGRRTRRPKEGDDNIARLDDDMTYGGLFGMPDIKVKSMMDTQSGCGASGDNTADPERLLCYRYE